MAETDRQRIAQLERELTELKARLMPESAPEPANIAPVEEGVRIFYPRSTDVDLPNRDETEKLLAIVARTFPDYKLDVENYDFIRGFGVSIWRLSLLKRTDKLTRLHDWAIEVDNFRRQPGGMSGDPMNGSFFAAVAASGDIRYTLGNSSRGIPSQVGLDYSGVPARPAWREVLERGTPRQPDPSVDYSRAPSSPAVVRFY